MKKKILTFFYILVLHSNAHSASEPQLPPPLPLSQEIANPEKKEVSFWDKTLNFFGLGNKKQENGKVFLPLPLENQNSKDLSDKSNNTADINSDSPMKSLPASSNGASNPSLTPSDPALISNENSDKNSLQKIPDISELKLPDGVKPDEELPNKPDITTSNNNNSTANNQALSEEEIKKETKTDISELKLPDGVKPDEELPNKPDITTSNNNNSTANNQALSEEEIKKETKTDISELKLPDGVKPDEELPNKPDVKAKDNTSFTPSKSTEKKSQNELEQNITLSLPTTDSKSASDTQVSKADTSTLTPDTPPENSNSKNSLPISTTGNLSTPPNDKLPENVKLTQNPATQSSQNNEAANVKTYRQHLQDRLNKTQKLPEISKDDLNPVAVPEDTNPAQMKFVNDEAQVLILPNDEVVLGEVTKESQLELMDLNSYLKIFWDNYNSIKNEPARQAINSFIENYDSNFNKQAVPSKNENMDALSEAFKAIDRNNIYDLINLLDGYPIIQLVDADGNTLLHKAVYKNNYSAAKFLIMKGIDLSAKNNQGITALEIAVAQDRPEIETLLRSAGGK
ncbi:MAG: ankyrin repeat domain-containing protein [Rickettsiaceae bacterium]|nr:ankyrin repeat domain-containing protein [Rickettsiaceae bacterium]